MHMWTSSHACDAGTHRPQKRHTHTPTNHPSTHVSSLAIMPYPPVTRHVPHILIVSPPQKGRRSLTQPTTPTEWEVTLAPERECRMLEFSCMNLAESSPHSAPSPLYDRSLCGHPNPDPANHTSTHASYSAIKPSQSPPLDPLDTQLTTPTEVVPHLKAGGKTVDTVVS
jgi:hypothetical protein